MELTDEQINDLIAEVGGVKKWYTIDDARRLYASLGHEIFELDKDALYDYYCKKISYDEVVRRTHE